MIAQTAELVQASELDMPTTAAESASNLVPMLVNARGAATVLALSLRKIEQMTAQGELPYLRIGRSVRYRLTDLQAWVEAQHKEVG